MLKCFFAMKSLLLSISLFSLAGAFSSTKTCLSVPSSSPFKAAVDSKTVLSAEDSASVSASEKKKPLSPKEILAQQRAKQGLPDPDKHPKLYSDELLDDMKETLLILEKRVQGGIGSISAEEVEKFVAMSSNILVEMKQKEYERLEDATSPSSPALSSAASSGASDTTATTATTASESSTNAPTATAVAEKTETEEDPTYDPEVEGPDYDPSGGQGSIPKDTTNTYIIPGMDAMSPEEYRDALQKSIIARQSVRKATGTYGNRNTWDYLNNLSGDTGVLKKDEYDN